MDVFLPASSSVLFAISLGLPSVAAHMKTFKNCFKILLGSFQNHAINTNITATAIDFRLRGVCEKHTVPTELSNLERTRVIKNASVAFRKSVIL